jgi:hypothetical protein
VSAVAPPVALLAAACHSVNPLLLTLAFGREALTLMSGAFAAVPALTPPPISVCRFGTRIVARATGPLASATKLRVGARFGGNQVLEPAGRSISRRVG